MLRQRSRSEWPQTSCFHKWRTCRGTPRAREEQCSTARTAGLQRSSKCRCLHDTPGSAAALQGATGLLCAVHRLKLSPPCLHAVRSMLGPAGCRPWRTMWRSASCARPRT